MTNIEEICCFVSVENCGYVDLRSLTALPEGTTFNNDGYVYLPLLTTLPEGTTFNNSGCVHLHNLTTLPEGTTFNNDGYVYLRNLTALSEGTTFNNGGHVWLQSLTTLPEGTTFNNGGYVYLHNLTTLPEGTTFNNDGYVYLRNLTDPIQTYRGQRIRLEHIDGYTMLIEQVRMVGEVELLKCRYFGGGDLDKLKPAWVARRGDCAAHGNTPEQAMRDLRFKQAQEDFDPSELVATIKARGTVEFDDFRLLTGACESGLRHGMEQAGLDPDATELPLATVLAKAHGSFGAAFRRLFVVAA